MNLSSRLQHLEIKRPKAATGNAKLRLEQHLQTIADRRAPPTLEEQQTAKDWLANEWPQHLERIRRNAA